MKTFLHRIAFLYLIAPMAIAQQRTGIGGVANNMMEPVSVFSDFIGTASMMLGAAFLFASIIKYMEHRKSPLMVPISTVVFLLLAGIFLIFLPLTYILTGYGIPYTLWKK